MSYLLFFYSEAGGLMESISWRGLINALYIREATVEDVIYINR
jgi:hypothetical protein